MAIGGGCPFAPRKQAIRGINDFRMDITLTSILLGGLAALLVGFAKTGMPGAGLPAVALIVVAFGDNTKLAVGAILPILIVGDIFAVIYYHHHAQWKKLWVLVPYVAAGMIPGYLVLQYVPDAPLRVGIGIIILLLLALQWARKHFGWEKMPDRWWFAGGTGILAGFGTTVGHAAGPVMSIYLIAQRMDKHAFMGTGAWFFLLVNCSKIPFYAYQGMVTWETLKYGALLVPVTIVGALLGAKTLKHIPQIVFDILVLTLAGATAIKLIIP